MNSHVLVVADTTPLNYLILIGHINILGSLFVKVLVPEGVLDELDHPKAPLEVKLWSRSLPKWVQVVRAGKPDITLPLGRGEIEAISLALEKQVRVILIDERKGRSAAQSMGLLPVGTLNLIDLADEMGLLSGVDALDAIRKTNFRAEPWLIEQLESKIRLRHR